MRPGDRAGSLTHNHDVQRDVQRNVQDDIVNQTDWKLWLDVYRNIFLEVHGARSGPVPMLIEHRIRDSLLGVLPFGSGRW